MTLGRDQQIILWNRLKYEGIHINVTLDDAEAGTYTDVIQDGKYTYKISFKREVVGDDHWDDIISIRRFYIVN